MLDLEKMTLSDLKVIAKENNIKNISKLKKEELIYEDESIFSCSVGVFVGYDVLWQQEGGRGKFGNDHASL